MSLVLRDPPELLPLVAAVAVARTVGDHAQIKWPNDVHVDGRKVAGILAEGRPQEGWAVLGVGLNVAVSIADLPEELHATATTMGLAASEVPAVRDRLLTELAQALTSTTAEILETWRERDALAGRAIAWGTGEGIARGVDGAGRLEVELPGGGHTALDAGEVHLRQVD